MTCFGSGGKPEESYRSTVRGRVKMIGKCPTCSRWLDLTAVGNVPDHEPKKAGPPKRRYSR